MRAKKNGSAVKYFCWTIIIFFLMYWFAFTTAADVSTQEELASDEEQLVHKTSSVVSIASPESPVSSAPTHLPLNALPIITSNIDPIPVIDEDEPNIGPPNKVVPAQESTPDSSTPNIASEQLRVLAENVLSLSNALSPEDRQTIMKFLEGTFGKWTLYILSSFHLFWT